MEDNSSLEKLKKRLYKEGDNELEKRTERRETFSEGEGIKSYWNKPTRLREDFKQTIKSMKKKTKFPYFWLFLLIGAIALFSFGGLYLLGAGIFPGANVVSSRNIDLGLEGPSLVNAGEYNRWFVSLTNNNAATLELSDVILKYPAGSLDADGEIIKEQRFPLGKVRSGENIRQGVGFFAMGEEEELKEIEIILEYRLEGSNAIFAKSELRVIKLSRSPVGISLHFPKETETGQELSLGIEYVSNSEVVLKNLYLKIEYPPGFRFVDSSLPAVGGKNEWEIGDLAPREQHSLEVKGILEGQDLTELVFHVSIGRKDENNDFNNFNSQTASVVLKRSFLNLSVLVNGKDVDVISSGKSLTITIPWENDLPTEVRNAVINVKLTGEVVDFYTLNVSRGFYRSSDNSIIWNFSSFSDLSSISPGETGEAKFSFSLKDVFSVEQPEDKNFSFVIEGEMTGIRISEQGDTSDIRSTFSKEVKIASHVQLVSSVLHYSGPFSNQGAVPPKVGEQTTYTISWSVSNFYNDVSAVIVRASLPSYISWLDKVDPAGEDVTYNASTGEVVWTPGLVEAGTGILRPVKTFSFQVALTPALNQVGDSPVLSDRPSFEGKDLFTGVVLRTTGVLLKTNSIPEAQFNNYLGKVIE